MQDLNLGSVLPHVYFQLDDGKHIGVRHNLTGDRGRPDGGQAGVTPKRNNQTPAPFQGQWRGSVTL